MNRRVILAICGAGGLIVAAWLAYTYWPVTPEPRPAPPVVVVKPKEKEKAPLEVKPPVFESAPVSLAAATQHYYLGKDAKQVGVKENAIVAQRAS